MLLAKLLVNSGLSVGKFSGSQSPMRICDWEELEVSNPQVVRESTVLLALPSNVHNKSLRKVTRSQMCSPSLPVFLDNTQGLDWRQTLSTPTTLQTSSSTSLYNQPQTRYL